MHWVRVYSNKLNYCRKSRLVVGMESIFNVLIEYLSLRLGYIVKSDLIFFYNRFQIVPLFEETNHQQSLKQLLITCGSMKYLWYKLK